MGVQIFDTPAPTRPVRFNSHTARGSSKPYKGRDGNEEHVSIPILHVGVQIISSITKLYNGRFQFPYCTWEFKVTSRCATLLKSEVSIPILHVGVQTRKALILLHYKSFNSHTARGSSNAGICNAHFIKFLSHISADR